MSYTAPSGSVWQITNNYDIKAGSNYYRAYAGEFRGSPNQNPQNDIQQSCSFACDSKSDCAAWSLDRSGRECYITGGNNTGFQPGTGNKAYVRTSARPAGKYSTIALGVTLSTVGGHYCTGDGWSGDGEGREVQNSGGNRYCVEIFPRPSRCPSDLGTPLTGNIVNKTNGGGINYATGTNNTGVICTYNTIPESIVWNQTKMGQYFQGNDTTGAIQQIKTDVCAPKSFSSPSLASIITPIENAIKPVCFAAECKACASSSADINLRTGSIQTCTDTINICLQNVTVRGDMKGTLNQACNINLDSSAPNTGGIPTSLQTTTDAAGTATVNASSGPDAVAGGGGSVSTVSRTIDGKKVEIDKLIIKPGKSAFVDKYLPTPEKQKMAIGACVVLIVIIFLALIFGGDDTPQQNPMEMQAMMLKAQLGI